MVKDQQVRKLMKLTNTEKTLSVAASKAGMDEKTARKYINSGKLPSQSKKQRWWKTRKDEFEEIWPEIEQLLKETPSIEVITIFEYLSRKYPSKFQEHQLRTLQRRVKVWRAKYGQEQEVMFVQSYKAGQQCQSDYTHMGELNIIVFNQKDENLKKFNGSM